MCLLASLQEGTDQNCKCVCNILQQLKMGVHYFEYVCAGSSKQRIKTTYKKFHCTRCSIFDWAKKINSLSQLPLVRKLCAVLFFFFFFYKNELCPTRIFLNFFL